MVDEIVNQLLQSSKKTFDHPTLAKIEAHKRTCERLWNLADIKGIRHLVEKRLTEIYQQKHGVDDARY
jgi:hypothetical protein